MPVLRGVVLSGVAILLLLTLLPDADAHVSGGVTKTVGDMRVQFTTRPGVALPNQPVALVFSVQDLNGNNLQDVLAVIHISRDNHERFRTGLTRYASGDFEVFYTFPEEGAYTVSLTLGRASATPTVDFTVTIWRDFLTALVIGNPLSVILLVVVAAFGVGSVANRFRSRPAHRPRQLQPYHEACGICETKGVG